MAGLELTGTEVFVLKMGRADPESRDSNIIRVRVSPQAPINQNYYPQNQVKFDSATRLVESTEQNIIHPATL